jgi:outer membrane biosynthesis protein TonB
MFPQVLPAMFRPPPPQDQATLRVQPWENSRLVWALAVSLLLHLAAFGIYKGGAHWQLWDKIRMPAWVHRVTDALMPALARRENPTPKPSEESPLMFVEVNPASAAVEAPKDARHYAAVNTVAAQPEPGRETGVPRIDGNQENVVRTEDSQLSRAQPLQPAPQQPAKPEEGEEAKPEPKPALQPGALTMAKPGDAKTQPDKPTERTRPRSVAEAKARLAQQQRLSTAGEKMRQAGDVNRRGPRITLDAVGTPFGAYDAAVVAAVQECWFGLLEQRSYASDKAGKVVLEFRLHYDGRVTDMKVVQNTVDELLCLLCQKAILDPVPYPKWPSEMRRLNSGDSREVRFTFFYN